MIRIACAVAAAMLATDSAAVQPGPRDLIEGRDGALLVLTDGDDGELPRLAPARR